MNQYDVVLFNCLIVYCHINGIVVDDVTLRYF